MLYRRLRTGDAAPQCISGRTSYLRVRLAFHPYPQLIQAVFNRHWFGRPRRNYLRFPLTMGRSRGFGSADGHEYALFVLAFALATPLNGLTYDQQQLAGSFCKRHAVARGRAYRASTAWGRRVSGSVSLRSRGTFHHSLTVLSAIGHQGIFRLSGWSRQIHTGFLGPRATWVFFKRAVQISSTGVLPSTPDLSHVLRLSIRFLSRLTAGRL